MTTVTRRPAGDLSLSAKGLALIIRFEGYVGHPYDDLRSASRYKPITSSLGTPTVEVAYPEWTGGAVRGTVTIGYGHTNLSGKPPRIVPGLRMTEPEALRLLRRVLADVYERDVKRLVKAPLTQGEYDALVSFCYNVGAGNLGKSTLLRRLNAGDYEGARHQFGVWTRAKGQVLAGLVKRRAAEADLFADREAGAPLPPLDRPLPPERPASAPAPVAPELAEKPPATSPPYDPTPTIPTTLWSLFRAWIGGRL
jgi:lysozyme